MRKTLVITVVAGACVLTAWAAKPRIPRPALPAAQYPLHETHAAEKVTIAAEPGDTEATAPKTRLDYFHHGFLPMRVIVTNDSDDSLTLDEVRIHFISADDVDIAAATDDDLQRRLFSRKSTAGTKIPLPSPLPSITIHHPPVAKEILADDADFGFHTTIIAPHSSESGYLYFDTQQVDEPALAHATLEVRRVAVMKTGKELFSFEIALKPTVEKATSPYPDVLKPGAATDAGHTKTQKDLQP